MRLLPTFLPLILLLAPLSFGSSFAPAPNLHPSQAQQRRHATPRTAQVPKGADTRPLETKGGTALTCDHGGDGGGGGLRYPPRGGGGSGGGGAGDGSPSSLPLSSALLSLYARYQHLLTTSPLYTKSISAGILTLLGDVIAQSLESRVEGYATWDYPRMAAFTVSGGFFVGPFVHRWYEVLWAVGRRLEGRGWGKNAKTLAQVREGPCVSEGHALRSFPPLNRLTLPKRVARARGAIQQVALDQTVGVALFFPAYFYVYELSSSLCTMTRPSFPRATQKLAHDLNHVLLNQYKVWPFINWVSFSLVPENLRVLFSNAASVGWNAFLCSQIGS